MKEKSFILHGPEAQLPFPQNLTVGQLMYSKLKSHGTKICQLQQETGEEFTYKQVLDKSCKLALFLRDNGIKVNDRISVYSENNTDWAVIVCASLFVGATICPLNPSYSKREFDHTVNISKSKYIFLSPHVLQYAKSNIKGLSWKPKLVLMLDGFDAEIPNIEKLIKNIPDSRLENFQVTNVNVEEHTLSILCSSGTTGLPKGVMLTNKNYKTLLQNMLQTAEGVNLCFLPFFHSYCFSVLIAGLIRGILLVVFSRFQEQAFLEAIEKYKIEILNIVPPLMVFLAKSPLVDKYDLSSLKVIRSAAAPLSREIELAVKKRLNNPKIVQAYGMTESTLTVVWTPENCNKPGTVGKLTPGVSAKVIPCDQNGSGKSSKEALGPYKEGELCFKGDLIMKGYCGDVTSTSATIDEDGWLHTGDVGYYDEDEFFYIVDRLKELIKYKGFQVPPAELEAILLTHPDIKDAAVVGLPDEKAGELPLAFVVKRHHAKITADDVVKYVNERVSSQKKLRGGVRFLEKIPKNQSGKILRRELRNLLKTKL